MIYDLKTITSILLKYNITPNQFHILYCAYTDNRLELKEYVEKVMPFNLKEVTDLADKGLIMKEPLKNVKVVEFLDIFVDEDFAKEFFIETHEAFQELYQVFPKTIKIKGKTVITTKGGDVNGKYIGIDEMPMIYSKNTSNSRELHNKIIKSITNANKANIINFTLRDFIINKMWEALFELEEQNEPYSNAEFI